MKRKTIFLTAILALIAYISFAGKSSAKEFAVGSTLENFTLKDTNGADQSFDKLKGRKRHGHRFSVGAMSRRQKL